MVPLRVCVFHAGRGHFNRRRQRTKTTLSDTPTPQVRGTVRSERFDILNLGYAARGSLFVKLPISHCMLLAIAVILLSLVCRYERLTATRTEEQACCHRWIRLTEGDFFHRLHDVWIPSCNRCPIVDSCRGRHDRVLCSIRASFLSLLRGGTIRILVSMFCDGSQLRVPNAKHVGTGNRQEM